MCSNAGIEPIRPQSGSQQHAQFVVRIFQGTVKVRRTCFARKKALEEKIANGDTSSVKSVLDLCSELNGKKLTAVPAVRDNAFKSIFRAVTTELAASYKKWSHRQGLFTGHDGRRAAAYRLQPRFTNNPCDRTARHNWSHGCRMARVGAARCGRVSS